MVFALTPGVESNALSKYSTSNKKLEDELDNAGADILWSFLEHMATRANVAGWKSLWIKGKFFFGLRSIESSLLKTAKTTQKLDTQAQVKQTEIHSYLNKC